MGVHCQRVADRLVAIPGEDDGQPGVDKTQGEGGSVQTGNMNAWRLM